MGILFATGDAIAIPSLELLHQHGMIGAILAPAYKPKTKNNNTAVVSEFATQHSIPLLQPATLDETFVRLLDEYSTNLLVCFAYGKYFTQSFLSYFANGAINVHPSLLPRFRGASPIVAAILAGEKQTGVTIQTISSRLDAGDIVYQAHIPIDIDSNAILIRQQVATHIARPLLDICQRLLNATPINYTKQHDNDSVYCRKIGKKDGAILWSMTAQHIIRLVQSMCYWPVAHTHFNGAPLNIIETTPYPLVESTLDESDIVANTGTVPELIPYGKVLVAHHKYGIMVKTGKDIVGILKLQLATRKIQHWNDFINGHKKIIGSVLA